MKKIISILWFATILFHISNLHSQEMTYRHLRDGNGFVIELTLNSYEVTSLAYRGETMHEISLSGIFLPNEEGMPNLPRISRFLAVPKDAEVSVSIKRMETETLHNINIAPALRIQAVPEEPAMDYVKNEQVYARNNYYPQNPVEISAPVSLRSVNTVIVGITPFQYNPVTKELIVINYIELEIDFLGGTKAYDNPKYRSSWFDPIIKNALLNYEVLPEIEYPAKSSRNGTGCEYLIVIPNRDDFMPFAEQIKEFRTKQGIYTKIMRLDEMNVTNTTQLKSFFHNAYNTWDIPPVGVLLMGDHNTNMALGIPAETIPHPENNVPSCITDNQYADVTGDHLPEMVFSRMAAENPAQMAVLVSKVFEYETQPCMEPSYYQNPITALGWQTERWFQICSEVVGGFWRNQGKTPVRINEIYAPPQNTSIWSNASNSNTLINYFGPSGSGYLTASPTELGNWSGGTAQNVIEAVNNGAFALQHRNHGNWQGWGEPSFNKNHINSLTNVGKMTYVFTINCQTGKFDNSPACFGEAFHRYTYNGQNAGCVGFLGPTEISYSFVNDVFAWGMYDLFDPSFLPTYGPQGPHSAAYSGNWLPAFGNVAGKYFLAQSSWPYYYSNVKDITYQMFTAHSDVFLRLFTEVPQMPTVTHENVTISGNTEFAISANAGTLIALTTVINGTLEILDVAVATGETQTMTIPQTLMPTTEINVVVTGQNYLRYEAVVEVVSANIPFIICNGYSTENEDELTYISTNSEIKVALKNLGLQPTSGQVTVTLSSNNPKLTIVNNTATCGIIEPEEIVNVPFFVTVAHDIADNTTFMVNVTIVDESNTTTWTGKFYLKAYAPVLSLEKVLVNEVVDGGLHKETLTTITVVVKNEGHAEAYAAIGNLKINDVYVTLACENATQTAQNIPVGETKNFVFYLIANSQMPNGYKPNLNFTLNALYERTFTTSFTVSSCGSNYCTSGSQNCNSNKFTLVQIIKNSDQSIILDNTTTDCNSTGYQDYTSTTIPLVPEEEYTIKVKINYNNQYVSGWFDWNGNNDFENHEQLINFICNSSNTEYTQTFTVPQNNIVRGTFRFRLVCKWLSTPATCNNSGPGQTHDYNFTIADVYPHVKNVKAEAGSGKITITWVKPENETPQGYNIFHNGVLLNPSLLTTTTFTDETVSEGVYAYHVTAVYDNNKESFAEMSNVICYFSYCEIPENIKGNTEANTAIISWNKPKNFEETLLGYNIYRNEKKINTTLLTNSMYRDENLEDGIYVYNVSAVYEFECIESELSESVTVNIDYNSITYLQTSSSFNLFPNPAHNELTLSGDIAPTNVCIYNLTGQLMYETNQCTANMHISVATLPTGMYFIKIVSEYGSVIKKVIVEK